MKRTRLCHHGFVLPRDELLFQRKKLTRRKGDKSNSNFNKRIENPMPRASECENNLSIPEESRCSINDLPEEIILKIFGYLSLGSLVHTVPQVCKKWEVLALDWSLWKRVENVTIENMVISTDRLRALLRTIPKLKKLELILR